MNPLVPAAEACLTAPGSLASIWLTSAPVLSSSLESAAPGIFRRMLASSDVSSGFVVLLGLGVVVRRILLLE